MLFYPSKFCFYTQRPCYILNKNFKQKVLDYLFLDILGIKWYSPVLCRGIFSDNLIKERKIKFIPFLKKNNVTKVVNTKKIRILCVAKYQPRKKIDLIIDSVKLMKSNFELTIIGTASTKERENYYNKLKCSIEEGGLEAKVNLLKDIPFSEMGNYYKLNDLFILMSENEVASVTQIEAMSYNLAIICSKDNGSAHYVKDNYNGFVINSNKEELTRALKLYMNDLSLLDTHKLNSGKRLTQKFNIDEAYNTFIKFIDTEEK
jgi:glycosyltransferase involved in cell wall biosynthesis